MNILVISWRETQRINTAFDKYTPQLEVNGDKIYYVWEEDHGSIEPIWVAEENVVE